MILRRIAGAFRRQDWFTVAVEVVIVVVGVFIGIQVSNWNEARTALERREQVTRTLLTDLRDGRKVKRTVIAEPIARGLAEWQAAFDRGERPPPFFLRISGSDTAPDIWSLLQQEQLSTLFDPVTLFDLGFYYSELNGVGRKYLRYIAFVEAEILPALKEGPSAFYDNNGNSLKPRYAASMDRLREFGEESARLANWTDCLIYRISAARNFEELCNRNGYVLEGMPLSVKTKGKSD